MKKIMITGILLTTTLLFARGHGSQDINKTIPPELIIACADKAENSTCSVINPRGDTLSGICKTTLDSHLACKVDRKSGGRHSQ